jgi:hypothetical protein
VASEPSRKRLRRLAFLPVCGEGRVKVGLGKVNTGTGTGTYVCMYVLMRVRTKSPFWACEGCKCEGVLFRSRLSKVSLKGGNVGCRGGATYRKRSLGGIE